MTITNYIFNGSSAKIFDAPTWQSSGTKLQYLDPPLRVIHPLKNGVSWNTPLSTFNANEMLDKNTISAIALVLKVDSATVNGLSAAQFANSYLLNTGLSQQDQNNGYFNITGSDPDGIEPNPLFMHNYLAGNANRRILLLNLLNDINAPVYDATTQNDIVYTLTTNTFDGNHRGEYARQALTETGLDQFSQAQYIDYQFVDENSNTIQKKGSNIYFIHVIDPSSLGNVSAELLSLGGVNVVSQPSTHDCWQIGVGGDSSSKLNFLAKGEENNCQLQLDTGASGTVRLMNQNLEHKLPTFLEFSDRETDGVKLNDRIPYSDQGNDMPYLSDKYINISQENVGINDSLNSSIQAGLYINNALTTDAENFKTGALSDSNTWVHARLQNASAGSQWVSERQITIFPKDSVEQVTGTGADAVTTFKIPSNGEIFLKFVQKSGTTFTATLHTLPPAGEDGSQSTVYYNLGYQYDMDIYVPAGSTAGDQKKPLTDYVYSIASISTANNTVTFHNITDGDDSTNDCTFINSYSHRENVSESTPTVELKTSTNKVLPDFAQDETFDAPNSNTTIYLNPPQSEPNDATVVSKAQLEQLRVLRYAPDGSRNDDGLILRRNLGSTHSFNYANVAVKQSADIGLLSTASNTANGATLSGVTFRKYLESPTSNMAVIEYVDSQDAANNRQYDVYITQVLVTVGATAQQDITDPDGLNQTIEELVLDLNLAAHQANGLTANVGSITVTGNSVVIVGNKIGNEVTNYNITGFINMSNLDKTKVNDLFKVNMNTIIPWSALEHQSNTSAEKEFKSDFMVFNVNNAKIVNSTNTANAYFQVKAGSENYAAITLENSFVHGNTSNGNPNSLVSGSTNLTDFSIAQANDFTNKLNLVKAVSIPVAGSLYSSGFSIMAESSKIHALNTYKNKLESNPSISTAFLTQDNLYSYVNNVLNTTYNNTESSTLTYDSAIANNLRNLFVPVEGPANTIKAHVEALYPEIKTLFESIQNNRTPSYNEARDLRTAESQDPINNAQPTLAAWQGQNNPMVIEDCTGNSGRVNSTSSLWEAMWRWSIFNNSAHGDAGLASDLSTVGININLNLDAAQNIQTNYIANIQNDNLNSDVTSIFARQSDFDYNNLDNNGIQFKGLLDYFGTHDCASALDGSGLFDPETDGTATEANVEARLTSNEFLPNFIYELFFSCIRSYKETSDYVLQTILGLAPNSSTLVKPIPSGNNHTLFTDIATSLGQSSSNFTDVVASLQDEKAGIQGNDLATKFYQNPNSHPSLGEGSANNLSLKQVGLLATDDSSVSNGSLNDLLVQPNGIASLSNDNSTLGSYPTDGDNNTVVAGTGLRALFNNPSSSTASGLIKQNQEAYNTTEIHLHLEYAINRMGMHPNRTTSTWNETQSMFQAVSTPTWNTTSYYQYSIGRVFKNASLYTYLLQGSNIGFGVTQRANTEVYHEDSLDEFLEYSLVPVEGKGTRRYLVATNIKESGNSPVVKRHNELLAAFFTYSSSRSDVFTTIDVSYDSSGAVQSGSVKGFIDYLAGTADAATNPAGKYIALKDGVPDVIIVPYLWRCESTLRLSIPDLTTVNDNDPRVRLQSIMKNDRKHTYLDSNDLISIKIMGKVEDTAAPSGFASEYSDILYIKDIANHCNEVNTDLIRLNNYIRSHFQSEASGDEPASDILNEVNDVTQWNAEDIKRWKDGQEQTTATTIAINMMKQMDANLLTSTGLYAEDKARMVINLLDQVATDFDNFETADGVAKYGNNDGDLVLYNILRDAKARTAKYNSLPNTINSLSTNLGFSAGDTPDLSMSNAIAKGSQYNTNLTNLQNAYNTARTNLLTSTNVSTSYSSLVNSLNNLQTQQNMDMHELEGHAATFTTNINNVKAKVLNKLYGPDDNETAAQSRYVGDFSMNYTQSFYGVVAQANKNIQTIFTELQKLDKDLKVRENQLNEETVKMRDWLSSLVSN